MATYPLSCVCYLEVGEADSARVVLRGSGWIAGPRRGLICTCGHNLARNGFTVGWVQVWIGGSRRRGGLFRPAKWWAVHPRWMSDAERASDLAVLGVGDLTAFGAFGFHDRGAPGMLVKVTGFPAEGPPRRRNLGGCIASRGVHHLRYAIPTEDGMSGAPVWTGGAHAPDVVGVHTRLDGQGEAVRLTPAHVEWIARHR